MAKFQLLNPVLRVVGQKYDERGIPVGEINRNVQNAGNKYLYSQLINLDCPWEGTQTYTSFQKPVVAIFEPLLSMQHGGIGQTDQAIPEMFQTIEGCYVSWKSPQPFYKKHLSAHPANPAKGTPAIMAGDIVKQGGVPVIYTELVVFCQYYYDSRGEKQWMRGSTPEEVGEQHSVTTVFQLTTLVHQQQSNLNNKKQLEDKLSTQLILTNNRNSKLSLNKLNHSLYKAQLNSKVPHLARNH